MKSLIVKEIVESISNWVFLSLAVAFILLLGLFLWVFPDSSYFTYGYASTELFFDTAYYLLLFVIPVLTISFFSNEFRYGTFETLAVLPLSWRQIVGAKFISGCVIVLLLVLLTFPIVWVIQSVAIDGSLDMGQVSGSYIGLCLIGAGFVAISIFVSSIVEQTALAFIAAIILGFVMYAGIASFASLPIWGADVSYYMSQLSWSYHGDYLSRGVISISSVTYLISWIFVFLLLASYRLTKKQF